MQLEVNKEYQINDSPIHWLFIGITDAVAFPCYICGKERKKTYEFIGYDNIETLKREQQTKNYNGWNYHDNYGSECIKKLKIKAV